MRRADRLLDLIARLKGGKLVVAEQLAEQLEVSVRTVYRDIAALQAQGLPIDGQAGLGYMLRGNVNLPALTLSHDQLDAVSLGLSLVEWIGEDDLAQAAVSARAKIDATWGDQPTPAPSQRHLLARELPHRKAPPFTSSIRRAIRERRIIKLDYAAQDGSQSTRDVRPLGLRAFHAGWLLITWCNHRGAFRVFRLDRILACELSKQTFPYQAERELAAYFSERGNDSYRQGARR
ncbi:YafY family transcriptional regulator [Rhodopseudomonas palustris]|uniref:helix-turn-helix transcriptional regulator n=1 Tax=Rhodopseudomonas palustris TaxID=1076 RepID=UPI0021F349BD|nr:YafY family protein [Rhodopseudomonas palustris]UYO43716.1 YafY family transcriptional regulator [Rhodopseudomonas palustris]